MTLATIRPDDWNMPLFVHVAGAMLLVGSLVVVAVLSAGALRRGTEPWCSRDSRTAGCCSACCPPMS